MPDLPTLRILFYVDDEQFLPGKLHAYSTLRLQEALSRGLFKVEVQVRARHEGVRLTEELLSSYDEIWFFLRRIFPRGKELDADEVQALHRWMNRGGGVLLAGDHAEKRGVKIYGCGGQVGRWVPRARHMRAWDEGLRSEGREIADTTESSVAGVNGDGLALERDVLPQRLLLPVDTNDELYPIFRSTAHGVLDRLPDHVHEGQVKDTLDKPSTLPAIADEWPVADPGRQIIARGIDWRHGRVHDLMAQWDGHRVAVDGVVTYGRILTDASFHHYVDDNLEAIALADGEAWKKIQELYQNQAAWLAPAGIRKAYREHALEEVSRHPYIKDAEAGDPRVDTVAWRRLAESLPQPWFHGLADDICVDLGNPRPPSRLPTSFGQVLVGTVVQRLAMARIDRIAATTPTFEALLDGEGQVRPRTVVPTLQFGVIEEAISRYEIAVTARQLQLDGLRAALNVAPAPGEA